MHIARRFRGIVGVALFLLTIVSTATAKYSGGTGEPNDPYRIATAADLIALGETPEDYDKHFILTADIDLDPNLPGRKVFARAVIAPSWDTPFTGVFDGNGHTISHLTIRGRSYLGLFGCVVLPAEVKSLGVVDVNVSGSGNMVGGLVGYHGMCDSEGEWCCDGGALTRCFSSGMVSGWDDVGGLVGETVGGMVSQCYSSVAVRGTAPISNVGGLIGHSASGGMVKMVKDCYATGRVTGTVYWLGGLVGHSDYDNTAGCFWDIQTSGRGVSAGGTGRTTAEMQTAATFLHAGWDFVGETANGTEDIWKIVEGVGYPHLSWEKYSGGTGEPNDPYQIATAADLMALGETPEDYDKHFLLTADIDLDPNLPGRKVFDRAVIAPDTDPCDSNPYGPVFTGPAFTGVFDGNGRMVSRLTVTGKDYLGLFGRLTWAEVRSVGVVDVNVTGSGTYVGGLASQNFNSRVSQCYSTGTVGGVEYVGGLVGISARRSAHITGSYSMAMVTGIGEWSRCVGGLVGMNDAPDGEGCVITNSYSAGSVSGNSLVGGLVGDNSGRIRASYSTGKVSCTGWWGFGGLLGDSWGTATGCFWDIETSGQTTSDGGTGKTTAEMQTAKTFLEAEWDFVGETANGTEDIWKIAEGLDYPRLWWEPYDGRVTVVLGQIFTVTLESNPGTGYRWEWVDHQDSIVEQMGEAQFKPRETGDPPLVGAGGWESFDFKAVNQGQMNLKLVYRRPWEEGVEPLKTFSLQVTVP